MRVLLQHVSATFQKKTTNHETEGDKTTKQVVLYKPEESGPASIHDGSKGTTPSVGLPPDPKGLTIVNQGQLTLHYHSYNEVSSPAPQSVAVSRKRPLDRAEDGEYSEALASLMEFDLSPESRRNPPPSSKRQRLEDPDIELEEPEVEKPQNGHKQEKVQPVEKKPKKKGNICTQCGKGFNPKQNKGSKQPCTYHPGTSIIGDQLTPHSSKFRRQGDSKAQD